MKERGFTLSEVLLVLVIIGVVAALTIPVLLQKASNAQYVVKLKKTYSLLSQVYIMIVADNGGDILPVFSSGDTGVNAMNAFASKMNTIKNCGSGTGCFYSSALKTLNGNVGPVNLDASWNGAYGKVILSDGTMVMINSINSSCAASADGAGTGPLQSATCGVVSVDVNGASGPNMRGRDFFYFWITKSGIYPRGNYDGYTCSVTPGDAISSQGCAAKILQEGTMDY